MTFSHPCCQLLPIVPDHYKHLTAIQQDGTENDLAENKEGDFASLFSSQINSQLHHFLVQELKARIAQLLTQG